VHNLAPIVIAADTSTTVIPRQSLQASVLERLRQEIIEGVWRPGVRLQERILCERFGISRSPLRETFQVLASEGCSSCFEPRRGCLGANLEGCA